MNLGERAYLKLYGNSPERKVTVRYHSGFKGYNANVRATRSEIAFSLSRAFESCEEEIAIGVMHELLNKMLKTRIESDEQELYHSFLRKMSDFAPVTERDPQLEESFARVNEGYFAGLMTRPNLVWGSENTRLLGTYTYATDTIMISSVLGGAPEELLDYVMYHEMLHKKHKFSCSSGRTHSHTKAFRRDEAKFSLPDAEAQLTRWLRTRQRPNTHKSSFVAKVMGWRNS